MLKVILVCTPHRPEHPSLVSLRPSLSLGPVPHPRGLPEQTPALLRPPCCCSSSPWQMWAPNEAVEYLELGKRRNSDRTALRAVSGVWKGRQSSPAMPADENPQALLIP